MFWKTSSCFTNQVFYVRNIPMCSYTINKITFIINTITNIIIIIIIIIITFNFSITIIIIIIIIVIITIIIKSTILSSFLENILKNISTSEFFTYKSIKASNFASMFCFNQELNLFYFSSLRYRNNKTYFRLLLLLSGNINLNSRPFNGSQQHNYDQWGVFRKRDLHFVHISINSLLPNIDELWYIAKLSEAAVIGISESKLDDSVLSSEI